jgi:ketosteroid isomerase-like protein
MSRQNVEIVRGVIEAFNRGDLEAAGRGHDPDVEVDWSRSRGLDAGVYRGYEATLDFWSSLLDMFDQITVAAELIECGEHVLVPNRTHFRGRDGIEVETQSAMVATVRDGRIVLWRLYQERAEALEAIGLGEQEAARSDPERGAPA